MYGWTRIPDGGWLAGKPGYESPDGSYFVAEDFGGDDDTTPMWFLHRDDEFVEAFATLREAVRYATGPER